MSTPSILVIDDEDGVLEIVREALGGSGLRVETAGDGPPALALLRRRPGFDLVLLDLSLPHMSGRELLQVIRGEALAARVIVMSGYGEDPGELLKLGATGFLQKPFRIVQLIETVQRAIDAA